MHEHFQCSLIPGPNWKWGNQDGGAGNIGRVFAVRNGVVEVNNIYAFVSLFNLLFSHFFSQFSPLHILVTIHVRIIHTCSR